VFLGFVGAKVGLLRGTAKESTQKSSSTNSFTKKLRFLGSEAIRMPEVASFNNDL